MTDIRQLAILCIVGFLLVTVGIRDLVAAQKSKQVQKPNILFILTDDQRWDSIAAAGNMQINTPNLDRIYNRGVQFENAFVTLAICSPSRAACLTGRYGSSNGVTKVGNTALNKGEITFAHALKGNGYSTGVTGKWHLKTSPKDCGFDFVSTCWSNGPWYDRKFSIDGESKVMPGFVDDVVADESTRFINQAAQQNTPFVLFLCTQVPHMDHKHTWPARQKYIAKYNIEEMGIPTTWNDDLSGKPEYLKTSRNREQALKYGYDQPVNIQKHIRDYHASVEQMDAAVGRVLDELENKGLMDNTWIIFMGDNGWMLGEHGMTSKVLPYEESMRVPMAIAGPNVKPSTSSALVLNIDLAATIYELAGLSVPRALHGHSLLPFLQGKLPSDWRRSFLYEAPTPQLGSKPLWAVRNERWKFVETDINGNQVFRELYDLKVDAIERKNLANEKSHRNRVEQLAADLQTLKHKFSPNSSRQTKDNNASDSFVIPEKSEPTPRTDLFISGVYPHLTTYGIYSQNGAHNKSGHAECGIGAIVPWAGKLWMVNYAPHMPKGSEHKLYSVDADLSQSMTIHPESVGGTPAGRMIHKESNQLLIAHYAVDAKGKVRAISPKEMPIRVTAIARHLTDPKNMVYYIDMEGSIWEANVYTLAVKQLFKKPVPGWHGKGGYTSQGRLVISNNGELHVGSYKDVLVGGEAKTEEERGVLAEFDGTEWKIVERRQFTEVTGPNGIAGGSDENDPLWAIGWDRRSLRLKLLEDGKWHTYLLPKSSFCNDASHGWYTEWPRIREITDGRWMMDMHGMFFDFSKSFSTSNSAGLRPIGSHLRYIPDFCAWNGRLVLATDETSIQGNRLAGQPQSNLWFGSYENLKQWGPKNAYGGPWIEDEVKANVWSEPFLIGGFDQRLLHLSVGSKKKAAINALRATDQQKILSMPDALRPLQRVTINRGDWHQPASGFSFEVDKPVTVFLAVDRRGFPKLPGEWEKTNLLMTWGKNHTDDIYQCDFPAGKISIPANPSEHTKGSFGMPHIAFVKSRSKNDVQVKALGNATVNSPNAQTDASQNNKPVKFTLQIDKHGNNEWSDAGSITVSANGYIPYFLPDEIVGCWIRMKTDRDCITTAYLHLTTANYPVENLKSEKNLFAGLADISDKDALGALIYAAKRNRNLRVITNNGQHFDFTKATFDFQPDEVDPELKKLLHVEQEFTVDEASVVLKSGGKTYRLPKGPSAFNKPFNSSWPRASREVESERHLANIHGTFYEIPLLTNGSPPQWNRMRPVSSHSKQITDFCSWNGLLVLTGVKADAKNDGHVFTNDQHKTALWFGAIDDLWKLGKPVGNGGPWFNSKVMAGVPSDPYLMTGYDEKNMSLSHKSKEPVTVTLQVDIDGEGLWVDYQTFEVPPGKTIAHEFPKGFSACWIRAVSNRDATATVVLNYE